MIWSSYLYFTRWEFIYFVTKDVWFKNINTCENDGFMDGDNFKFPTLWLISRNLSFFFFKSYQKCLLLLHENNRPIQTNSLNFFNIKKHTHTHLQSFNAKCLFWVYTNLRKSFIQLVKQTKWNKTEIPHEPTELINQNYHLYPFFTWPKYIFEHHRTSEKEMFWYIKHIDILKTLNEIWCFRCFLYNFKLKG